MENSNIIVSETNRPIWKLILAALLFTIAIYFILEDYKSFSWNKEYLISYIKPRLKPVILLTTIGVMLSFQKKIYINLKESKFKPSFEIAILKFGQWKTINNYEYISIYYNPSKEERNQFEVNLWYDKNKHFELYSRNNFEDAITVAYDLSEVLDIDLLDATIAGDFKWIDKEELKANN